MGLISCCRFSWGESQSAPHSFYPAGLSRAKYILLCVSEVWQTKRNIVPVLFPSAGRYYLRGEMRGLQRALQEMSHCSPLSKVWFTAPSRNTSIQPHCGICLILIHIYLSNLFFSSFLQECLYLTLQKSWTESLLWKLTRAPTDLWRTKR